MNYTNLKIQLHELQAVIYNVMKDSHRYDLQGSDTTMMPMAASLPGQQLKNI